MELRRDGILNRMMTFAVMLITVGAAVPALATEPEPLRIVSPQAGARVRMSIPLLEVRGRVGLEELYDGDVAIAIDLSQSALYASGLDVDADGNLGVTRRWAKSRKKLQMFDRHHDFWTSDPDDTILEAEMIAARSIIEGLAPRKNRIGVLTYTEVPRVRAWVGAPEIALASLDSIQVRMRTRGTDIGRALASATRMLEGLPAGRDRARKRAILLFIFAWIKK